jgi:site-specific recombinase XerD
MGSVDDFLNSEERSKATVDTYGYVLNCFDQYLQTQKKTIDKFTRDDVIAYYKEQKWESSSTQTFLSTVKSFVKWRLRQLNRSLVGADKPTFNSLMNTINDFNDIRDMKRPKLVEKMRRDTIMSTKMLNEMFTMMIQRDPSYMDFRFAWCIWWFGCRVGELLDLDMNKSVNFESMEVTFITEKTRKERLGWFDEYTGRILLYFRKNPERFNITRKTVWQRISKYGLNLGMEMYTKRGRQTFQTYMDRIAENDKELKEKYNVKLDDTITKILVGHTIKGNMTAIYKQYPVELLKEFIMKHHYMIPFEEKFQIVVEKKNDEKM